MATLGDPLMDLGSALAYWVEADDDSIVRAHAPPADAPARACSRDARWSSYYLERTGLHAADWTFYEVYGLFRLAVIAQQIYYRYHHRQTRNPAFRHFWMLVHYFDWRCRRVIARAGS